MSGLRCHKYPSCHQVPGGWRFPLSTMSMTKGYFHRKYIHVEGKKNFLAVNSLPTIVAYWQLEILVTLLAVDCKDGLKTVFWDFEFLDKKLQNPSIF